MIHQPFHQLQTSTCPPENMPDENRKKMNVLYEMLQADIKQNKTIMKMFMLSLKKIPLAEIKRTIYKLAPFLFILNHVVIVNVTF